MRLLIILTLLTSCGLKTKVSGGLTPTEIKVQPDFARAAEICDDRYGVGTDEAEACFKDFRSYYDVEVSLNLASITKFCKENYINADDIKQCVIDLSNVLKKSI